MAKKGKKKRVLFRSILLLIFIGIAVALFYGYRYYRMVFEPNVQLRGEDYIYFYIPTGFGIGDVETALAEKGYLIDFESFVWLTERKNYRNNVHPGRYMIYDGMSNNELINLLRSGIQEPLDVVFNTVRTKERLAGIVADYIEADSLSIVKLLNDNDFIGEYGFDTCTIIGMFIPNTYQFNWNTSAKEFFERMNREYEKFWNDERRQKAEDIGLDLNEVSTLASIIEMETQRRDEKPRVAGVYMNRLKKGMLLQADPTLIFAIGDFSIRRVLKRHKEVDSPYNTYKYTGLPPGPIALPSISSLNAVLNYEKHDYLYFCAKEDFSGYHNFAKTLEQHNLNAKRYRAELNRRKILN
ncbi:MAG: endolytic transglycosylase MltG [Bacteroidetes bacterium]|nr:endolytic transglycosylase MltG [Bacteroidota bacterium]